VPTSAEAGGAPTIADVARRVGCSKSTVARVLNGRPDVNAETRARILRAMDELGFVADERARALASGRSRTLGLMLANLTSPYTAELIRSLEGEARRQGYAVLLMDTGHDPEAEAQAVLTLRQKRVDGVVAVPIGTSDASIKALLEARVPTVLVARYFRGLEVDVVRHDNRQAAYLALRHLLELGHRRILYVGRAAAISTVEDRLAGLAAALSEAGLPRETVAVRETEVTARCGYELTLAEAQDGFPYTAVVAYNDYVALGIMRALKDRGLLVPADVSVVACADTGIADFMPVRLTTVSEEWADVGRRAAQVVLARIEGEGGAPRTLVLPVRLMVRDSSSAPPATV
jgi:LacI family transcriptional regulator